MPRGQLNRVVRQLRRAALARDGGGVTDGQLLGAFLARRDEAAFTALVRRHGPMVFSVCRRVLGSVHDAEDAFQATFLVFVRKAAAIVERESVGSWLYGVAHRTALAAQAGRRSAREKQVRDMPHPLVEPDGLWREALPVLDRELSRLPEKYRLPVVLCELEGRSRQDVARQLRIPAGTLSSRLATARKLLARRLTHRGVALSAGGVTALLTQGGASAGVPAPLFLSTTKAALMVAAGQAVTAGIVPARVAALTEAVMKAVLIAKLKVTAVVVLVALGLGVGGMAYRSGGVQAAPPDAPAATRPQSELEALRKENELLKLNLQLVLEKVRAQESELQALRPAKQATKTLVLDVELPYAEAVNRIQDAKQAPLEVELVLTGDATTEAEAALQALRAAKDPASKRKAADALEKALKKLKEQMK